MGKRKRHATLHPCLENLLVSRLPISRGRFTFRPLDVLRRPRVRHLHLDFPSLVYQIRGTPFSEQSGRIVFRRGAAFHSQCRSSRSCLFDIRGESQIASTPLQFEVSPLISNDASVISAYYLPESRLVLTRIFARNLIRKHSFPCLLMWSMFYPAWVRFRAAKVQDKRCTFLYRDSQFSKSHSLLRDIYPFPLFV